MALPVVSSVLLRLGDLLMSEAAVLYGVSSQIKKVKRQLERMECFLEEADKKQIRDKRVRQWVGEIKELAFRIEDVIDTFALEIDTKNHNLSLMKKVTRCPCILSEGICRHNIATDISDITDELADITACLQTYGITRGLEEGDTSNSQLNIRRQRKFYSNEEEDFVGMEKEIKELISDLMKDTKVVSIWGMGGQGKTTLAKKVYTHNDIRLEFEAFAQVCITQQFDLATVRKKILNQLLNSKTNIPHSEDEEKLKTALSKVQQDKKCLILIDDVWTVDSWNILKDLIPDNESTRGSKVLLTTRDERVAKMGSDHTIEGLSQDEACQLLFKKAEINHNTETETSDTAEMKSIAKEIVEKCKRLPLAISSVGGILKGKSLGKWKIINEDISFYLANGEGIANDDEYTTVRQVLGMSYDSLPPRLRQCFLCFANYEEDEEIETEELYNFWMAEGLISIEHKAKGEMMLDVAERYLNELAHRSLVHVRADQIEGGSWSKYIECSVHDLIRELCLSKIKEEKAIDVISSQPKYEDESKASIVRRLCIHSINEGNKSVLRPYNEYVMSHI